MKKILTLAMMAILCSAMIFAGGSNESAESSDSDSFTIAVSQQGIQPDYATITNLQKYEEISGVHIDWINVPSEIRDERLNLILASGDLPDAFMKFNVQARILQTYGEAGDFLDLSPLLEEHAPNFMKFANAHPDVLASITSPDGKIYSIPAACEAPSTRINLKWFFNQEWLDNLGLEQPTNTEELYQVLKAFKTQDPNGNGIADEIPIYMDMTNLYSSFGGMFGCFNRGAAHTEYWDSDPETGNVRYIKTSDAWRECLEYLNRLYSEGLIDRECVTYSVNTLVGYASQDRLGVYCMTNLARLPQETADKFVPIETAIEGPNGDKMWAPIRSYLHSVGAFVITTECDNPEKLLEWVDYFYRDEGCLLYHYGTVGETCTENEDGSYSFLPEILAPMNEGKSYDETLATVTPYAGGNNPTRMAYPYFCGMELTEKPMIAADNLLPYTPDVWPILNYTEDELDIINTTGNDIDTYVRQMCARFVTGEETLNDTTWANYVSEVERMGLASYAEAVQNAVDRAEAVMVSAN